MEIAEIRKLITENPFEWFVPEDKMVVIRIESETKSAGGIIIPDSVQEKPHKGVIIALGPDITTNEAGLKKANCQYAVGDFIIFGKYAGTELRLDCLGQKNVEVMLMRLTDYMIGQKWDRNAKQQ